MLMIPLTKLVNVFILVKKPNTLFLNLFLHIQMITSHLSLRRNMKKMGIFSGNSWMVLWGLILKKIFHWNNSSRTIHVTLIHRVWFTTYMIHYICTGVAGCCSTFLYNWVICHFAKMSREVGNWYKLIIDFYYISGRTVCNWAFSMESWAIRKSHRSQIILRRHYLVRMQYIITWCYN